MARVTPLVSWIACVARDAQPQQAEILLTLGQTIVTLMNGFMPMLDTSTATQREIVTAQKRMRILDSFVRHGVVEHAESLKADLRVAAATADDAEENVPVDDLDVNLPVDDG